LIFGRYIVLFHKNIQTLKVWIESGKSRPQIQKAALLAAIYRENLLFFIYNPNYTPFVSPANIIP